MSEPDFETLLSRLRRIRDQLFHGNESEMAREADWVQSTVNRTLNPASRLLRSTRLRNARQLAEELIRRGQVRRSFIETGEGPLRPTQEEAEAEALRLTGNALKLPGGAGTDSKVAALTSAYELRTELQSLRHELAEALQRPADTQIQTDIMQRGDTLLARQEVELERQLLQVERSLFALEQRMSEIRTQMRSIITLLGEL